MPCMMSFKRSSKKRDIDHYILRKKDGTERDVRMKKYHGISVSKLKPNKGYKLVPVYKSHHSKHSSKRSSRRSRRSRKRSSRRSRRSRKRSASQRKKARMYARSRRLVKSTKKYSRRPSPPYPANRMCGMRKRGNDGNMYVSKRASNGICRWQRT